MDFLVSARFEGDSEGLVDAAKESGDAVDKLADRAAAAQKKITDANKDGAAAEKSRADAATAAAKATTEAASANDNGATAAAAHAKELAGLGQSAARAATDLATGRTGGVRFMEALAGITTNAVALAGPLVVAGALAATLFAVGIVRADAMAAQVRGLNVELAALGKTGQLSGQQLLAITNGVGDQPGVNRSEASAGGQAFLQNGIFNPATLQRGLDSARNLALAMGTDLPDAAKVVSGALSGTGDGLDKLDAKFHFLNDTQRVQIRTLQELGQQNAVTGVVLDALGNRLDGLGDKALGAGQKIDGAVRSGWEKALDAFAKSDAVQNAASAVTAIGDAVGNALGPRIGTAAQQLAAINAELTRLQALQNAGIGTSGAQVRIRSLTDQAADLQRQRALQIATDPFGPGQGAAYSEAGNFAAQSDAATKKVRELNEALDTVPRQREKITNALALITQQFQEGAISADAYATAAGLLGANLDKIQTPTQRSALDLGNAQDLANAPRNQRDYRRWMQGAEREARGIPATAANGATPRADFLANRSQQFTIQFDQQSADAIEDLRAAAQNTLAAVNAYSTGPGAALRAQALGEAGDRVRTGQISGDAAGPYAQELLNNRAAGQVLDFSGTVQSYTEQTAALQRLVAAEGQGSAATREAERVNQVAMATSRLRASVEASGSDQIAAAAQKVIASYEEQSRQQANLQRQREAQQLNQQFDPNVQYQQQIAKLQELQSTGVLTARTVAEATKQYEQQRLDASRDATDGMIAGLRRYADEATNAGASAATGIRSAMASAEDAVVQFATTGQISVSNLANSIIADLARVAIRQTITGPLSSAFGNLLTDIFSGGGSVGAQTAIANSGNAMAQGLPFALNHAGGVVGDIPYMTRNLPLATWTGARRYHDGGVVLGPNEVPIIAQKGERVLTKDQQAAGGGGITVNVINNTNSKVSTRSSTGANGAPVLDILIEQMQEAIAADINNGRGPITSAMQNTFGAVPIGRGG